MAELCAACPAISRAASDKCSPDSAVAVTLRLTLTAPSAIAWISVVIEAAWPVITAPLSEAWTA